MNDKKIKFFKPALFLGLSFLLPLVSFAEIKTLKDLITEIVSYLGYIAPLLIAFAIIGFLYGIIQYVWAGGDEDKRKEGRDFMIYGIIGVFVMVSVWGLVSILVGTFGFQASLNPIKALQQ